MSLHVHYLNPGQCLLCDVHTFESKHRTTLTLYTLVIPFDDSVEILALANLNALSVGVIVVADCSCIRTTFVDIDEPGFAVPRYRFGQKLQSRLLIALGRKQKVDGIALFIHRSIEILPLAFDLDVSLVESPSIPGPFLFLVEGLLECR